MEAHNCIVGSIFLLGNQEVLMDLRKWFHFLKFQLKKVNEGPEPNMSQIGQKPFYVQSLPDPVAVAE